MWKLEGSASTDLETEVFGGLGIGVTAEVLVDDDQVFAGAGLEEVRLQNDIGIYSTCVFCLRAVSVNAWAMDVGSSHCRRDK